MRTWVVWTHYDCDVNIALYATEDECYQKDLKSWLESCDEDCGHNPDEEMSASEISSALEWHMDDELSWGVYEVEVPVAVTTPEDIEQIGQTIRAARDAADAMPAFQANDLMARLESFSEQP